MSLWMKPKDVAHWNFARWYMQASTQYVVFYAGALLWDVCNRSEIRKDGPAIARLLFEMGTEIIVVQSYKATSITWRNQQIACNN
jgi:hypothetical protein